MQAESQMVPIEEMNDSDVAEEQVFSQWVNRRLALYQAMEQQVQTGVAHLLQLANEFTVRMGKETDDLLSRYRQQRLELQSQLEALRQEAQRSRQEMADERRAHAMHIAKVRQQEEAEIARRHREAQAAIEAEQAAARAEREELLRQAYAERDHVLAETRALSARLAELQRSLQQLAGLGLGVVANLSSAPVEISSPPEKNGRVESAPAEAAADPVGADEESEPDHDDAQASEPLIQLVIEGVENTSTATTLVEMLESRPEFEEVNLMVFEEPTLHLAVRPTPGTSIATVLERDFMETFEVVIQNEEIIHLCLRLQPESA